MEFIHVNSAAGSDDVANGLLAEARAKIAAFAQAKQARHGKWLADKSPDCLG